MNTFIKDIRLYTRELCINTNIRPIVLAVATLTIYLVFLFISNRELFLLVFHINGMDDYSTKGEFIARLETLQISRMNMLIPIVAFGIFLNTLTGQVTKNIENRLLPVSSGVRVLSVTIITIMAILISSAIVVLLDHIVIAIMRYRFWDMLVDFRHAQGDLYYKLRPDCILSSSFIYPLNLSNWLTIIFLAPFLTFCALLSRMVFYRNSFLKTALVIAAILGIIFLFGYIQASQIQSSFIRVDNSLFGSIYTWILMICLPLAVFFAFKEREG